MDIQYLIISLIGLVLFIMTFVCPDKVVRADTPEKQKQLITVMRICGAIMFVVGLFVALIKG